MFTGIITELGTIKTVSITPDGAKFVIHAPKTVKGLERGESVSINGACHTALRITGTTFEVLSMLETLERTMMDELQKADIVNLERAKKVGDTLDGHIVQGHVDTTAEISKITKKGHATLYTFTIAGVHMKYIVPKGSIAINGISLTVVDTTKASFTVSVLPHTRKYTTLRNAKVGTIVNIELDQTAKYLEKWLLNKEKTGVTDGENLRIAIILPRYNDTIGQSLLRGAQETLLAAGIDTRDITVVRVPGAFEIPLIAETLALSEKFDAIIALGVVIRGETTHYDQITMTVAQQISEISITTGVPILHGIVTTETVAQARARSGMSDTPPAENKGAQAAQAAIEMAQLMQTLTAQERTNLFQSWNPSSSD